MSIETFKVTPPRVTDEDEIKRMHYFSRSAGPCWLCGARTPIRVWGAHVEKHRREGWLPRPVSTRKGKDSVLVFVEWQQRDATPEELAEWDTVTP